jgi:hypothetical protein
MESAVQSAIKTAGSILKALGVPAAQIAEPRRISKHPRWYVALLWWVLLPAIVPIYLWAKLKERTDAREEG